MLEFHIPSMACGGCAARITRAIQSVEPEARVEIDLKTRNVRVDTGAPREAVATLLSSAGYAPVE